jgi:hypothetical protein
MSLVCRPSGISKAPASPPTGLSASVTLAKLFYSAVNGHSARQPRANSAGSAGPVVTPPPPTTPTTLTATTLTSVLRIGSRGEAVRQVHFD